MNKRASVIQRRLAAIFYADVAGYVRLMNVDETGTLALLDSCREIMDRHITQHGGRTANTAGDSILAEFPSVVDAVQCAVGIQERIAAANEETPKERRLTFRIGVHVGEVMVRDGDMFGDGVNIAARMEKLAQPGLVCLSGMAYDYVSRVVPLAPGLEPEPFYPHMPFTGVRAPLVVFYRLRCRTLSPEERHDVRSASGRPL